MDPMYAYIYFILIYFTFQMQIHFIFVIHKCLVKFAIRHLFINTFVKFRQYFSFNYAKWTCVC